MLKGRTFKIFQILFLSIYLIFSVLNCSAIFKYNSSVKFILIFAFSIICVYIFIINKKKQIFKFKNKNIKLVFTIILILIGVMLRLLLFIPQYRELTGTGDYQTFFYNANGIAENNQILWKTYIQLFPYLMPYIIILGMFFKVFKNVYKAIILLNVLLDLLTALLLNFIFKDKRFGKNALIVWLLNPLNIIWCSVCCPIVLTNFGIALSILIFKILINNITNKKFIIYSVLTGIIMGIANSFRPLMIIMIIAIFIYYFYINLKNKKEKVINYIISFIIIFSVFIVMKTCIYLCMDNFIGDKVSRTQGWTLYVGSNLESNGTWYPEPKLDKLLTENISPEEIQQIFLNLAIQRYKENGILNNIKLFKEKFIIMTGNVAYYTCTTFFNTVNIINNNIEKAINIIPTVYIISQIFINMLLLLNIYLVFLCFKSKEFFCENVFIMLLYIGIVLAHLFVEVSERYFMPALVPLSIIASISISYNFERKSNTKNKEKRDEKN